MRVSASHYILNQGREPPDIRRIEHGVMSTWDRVGLELAGDTTPALQMSGLGFPFGKVLAPDQYDPPVESMRPVIPRQLRVNIFEWIYPLDPRCLILRLPLQPVSQADIGRDAQNHSDRTLQDAPDC